MGNDSATLRLQKEGRHRQMNTNPTSISSTPSAPDYINEEFPDPHPRDLGSSEIFCDLESDFKIPDIQARAIELTNLGHTDTQIAQLILRQGLAKALRTQHDKPMAPPSFQPDMSPRRAQRSRRIETKFSPQLFTLHLCESDLNPTSASPFERGKSSSLRPSLRLSVSAAPRIPSKKPRQLPPAGSITIAFIQIPP